MNTKNELKKMNKRAIIALFTVALMVYAGIFIVAGVLGRIIFSVGLGISVVFVIIMLFFVKDF